MLEEVLTGDLILTIIARDATIEDINPMITIIEFIEMMIGIMIVV
jgi:hypothetical protein